MQDTTHKLPSFSGKFKKLFERDIVNGLWRFLKGYLLVMTVSNLGIAGLAIAGAITTGLSLYKNYVMERQQEKGVLHQYRAEIAQALHKAPADLTTADLDPAAKLMSDGHNPVARDIAAIRHNAKLNHAVSLIGGIATTALTAAIPSVVPKEWMKSVEFRFIAGFLSNLVYMSTDHSLQKMIGVRPNFNLSKSISQLSKQLKVTPVSPDQVFEIFLQGNPAIDSAITTNYRSNYMELSLAQKNQVVEYYKHSIPAKEWADALNTNKFSPTSLAFAVMDPASSPLSKIARPATDILADTSSSKHVDRLASQKTGGISPVLH